MITASDRISPCQPVARKPPCFHRLSNPALLPPWPPNSIHRPKAIMPIIASTLISANQNSASPYKRTLTRLTAVNNDEESRRPNPGGHVGKPVLHIDPGGGQLRHPYQHEHHPVVPAGEKAGERPPVFIGKVGKGTGYWLFHHHFAQLAHDQKNDNPGHGVAQ
ncbi:Uncharacterised protein [Klebsiella pneumoniae]|uniref:Uncharacterized protein n=1 Tax=Klebsiella pneumoniae TaxID=573 RepID=A0A377XRY8_KLEPN|nr:Uncharacterised protein [Klebsiella pneumoniae]